MVYVPGSFAVVVFPTYPYTQNKNIAKNNHFVAERKIAHTLVLFLLPQLYVK